MPDMIDREPALDVNAVRDWLYYLHGDCPGFSVISSPGNWSGRAFEVADDTWPDEVVSYITRLDKMKAKGIYLRVTTVGERPEEGRRRGRDEDSIALPALWLDMDIAGPGHKPIKTTPANPNPLPLPPDELTCRQILDHSGLPEPTMWVHSGGGLYPWFFFKEPVKLLTPDDIEAWTASSQRLHDTVHAAAADLGWHYGMGIHDMSRVMRIPGTVNRKVDGAPTQARFFSFADRPETGQTFFPDELQLPVLVDSAPVAMPAVREKITVSSPSSPSGKRPGEDYNERGDVLNEVLLPEGWTVHSHQRGGEIYLTRPGKEARDGHSASLGFQGSRNLYVWSTDSGLPCDSPLSPFYLYAEYAHAGNFAAAAKDLAQRGFGDPLPAMTTTRPERPRGPVMASPPASPVSSPPVSSPPAVTSVSGGDDESGLLCIDVTDTRKAVLTLIDHLGTSSMDHMFLYSGSLVSVGALQDEAINPNADLISFIRTGHAMRTELMAAVRAVRWKENKEGGGTYVTAQISTDIASTVLAGAAKRGKNLRTLRGVSRTPVIREDGTVWDTRGYDPRTHMVYLPDEYNPIPTVSSVPSESEVRRARSMIDYMLCDFPWVSPADKINYIGMLFTPLLTTVTTGAIKMGVISAHQPGSGKTLLANILSHLHGGSLMPSLKNGGDEEIRKIVTSTLRNPSRIACWDNVRGELDSSVLDALLTTRHWTDRVLGKSEMVTTPNDKLWVITGNNVTLGSDLTRRAVWACINPNMPNPENRHNFAVENLEMWVQEHRGDLLWALYTLVQHWSVSGAPKYCARSDLFCGWSGIVNGIIRTSGWDGEFDTVESRQQTSDAASTEWAPLFEAIMEKFGEQEWTVRGLLELVSPSNSPNPLKPWSMDVLPLDLLQAFQSGSSAVVARTLGVRLKGIEGRFIDGVKVIKNPQRTALGFRWHLVKYVPPVASEQAVRRPASASPFDTGGEVDGWDLSGPTSGHPDRSVRDVPADQLLDMGLPGLGVETPSPL